jgi:predicted amidohydrolase YtcJ
MCLACDWAKYFPADSSKPSPVSSLRMSRRTMLQAVAIAPAAIAATGTRVHAQPVSPAGADVVFHNGPVYTVNAKNPWARAVAVKGHAIAYVGDDAGAKPFIGPNTRLVDLKGKMLLPGFVEGHTHPVIGATITRGIDLQFDTREECLAELRKQKTNTIEGVIRGFGWRYTAFPATGPRKEDLDAIWPDVPVLLAAVDGHGSTGHAAATTAPTNRWMPSRPP